MPIYEYQCAACGRHFDAIRSMKDADSPITCKHCESKKTKRKISRFFSRSSSPPSSTSGGCGSCGGGSCSSCRR